MAKEVAIIADSRGEGYYFAKGIYKYLMKKNKRKISAELVDIERSDFKDGEFKVRIADNIRRRMCFFVHDSNKEPCKWFTELNFVLNAIAFSSPEEISVVLPYLRFSRQDRKSESRVGVSSKVVAENVSLYSGGGIHVRGMTVDLHAPQIQMYFNVPFDNLYSFPVLIGHLERKHPEILENLVIVSPDPGGAKRAEALVNKLEDREIKTDMAVCYKKRKKDDEVEETKVAGEVDGKNCLIVDDIIDTGGTMIATGNELKQMGARKVYAYGTHGLFTAGTEKFRYFDKVFVSDTLKRPRDGNIEVVSLIELFGEAVYRTVVGESLSSLFE